MKKTVVGILAVLSLTLVLAACGTNKKTDKASDTQNGWEKVEASKKLTVATAGTLFPASYYNDENKLTGYDVEVIREVGKRLGLTVDFKESNIDGQLASLKNGTADVAANDYSLNKTRADKFMLSDPIKYSFGSMIVRKSDDSGIRSFDDLKGKKAAGEATTNYMKIAENFGAELVSYDNATNQQYLTDVANGRTDVILNDYYLQKMSVGAMPDIPVKILEDVYFNETHSGFLLNNDNEELAKKINEQLDAMRKDGKLKEISEKFFYADVTIKPDVKIEKTVDVN